jgi:predicted RNase H-like nuclease (RuvC/YqgF family)
MIHDLDARLALTRENETLRNGSRNSTEQDHIADLNRRLMAESAEKERLRRELERAEAKLEAIATLEGGKPDPRP